MFSRRRHACPELAEGTTLSFPRSRRVGLAPPFVLYIKFRAATVKER